MVTEGHTLKVLLMRYFFACSISILLSAGLMFQTAEAREIRIFPVPAPAAPCAIGILYTACDLVRAAAGFAPTTGPDANIQPQPGDTLVLAPGTYFLTDPIIDAVLAPANGTGQVLIPGQTLVAAAAVFSSGFFLMEGLTIRSRDGAEVTVIDGQALNFITALLDDCVLISANNVTFGGDQADQGITVQNCVTDGITIGADGGGLYSTFGPNNPRPAGQAGEDITIQHAFIQRNCSDGIEVEFGGGVPVQDIENFRFLYNTIRNNGGDFIPCGPPNSQDDGIEFDDSVGNIGGASEDEGVFFIGNIIDTNSDEGIDFENTGDHEQVVIQGNYILRNGNEGVEWGNENGKLKNILFKNNIVMRNGFGGANGVCRETCTGLEINNTGDIEDFYIIDNRDDQFEEGITGNACAGILIYNENSFPTTGPVGAGVRDIDRMVIENNVINDNGVDLDRIGGGCVFPTNGNGPTPRVAGIPGIPGRADMPIGGIIFANNGDIKDLVFRYNNIRLNAGTGISIGYAGNAIFGRIYPGYALTGDVENAIFEGNVIWNNGRGVYTLNGFAANSGPVLFTPGPCASVLPQGDGLGVFVQNDILDLIFRDNEVTENCNNGVFLSSSGSDVDGARFYNNKINKNGLNTQGVPFALSAEGVEISAFGDIRNFFWDGGEANDNGGNGVLLDASNNTLGNVFYGFIIPPAGTAPVALVAAAIAPNLADIDRILFTNSQFYRNGSSAPIGSGNGILVLGDNVDRVEGSSISAGQNDDHGVQINSVDDINDVRFSDSTFEDNDQNRDSVGSGVDINSSEDMNNIHLANVVANQNHIGIRLEIQGENGRDLTLESVTANDNDEQGALVDGSDDLSDVSIIGGFFYRNNTGITLRATDRGEGLLIDGNQIKGENGAGVGIDLQAIGILVTNNSIRDGRIGILATRAFESNINNNNIARNKGYAIDALGLKPGERIDATNNWWGEPSGPDGNGNSNGLGGRVTDKVSFEPWLGEPAVETDVNFQLVELNVPDTATVGESFNINALVRNNGSEEGSQSLRMKIECFDFIETNSVSRTLNPATEIEVDFNVVFPRGGECAVTVSTQNDSQTVMVTVLGATGVTVESVCDANGNNRIDDDEIITCVGFWVLGDVVPGTGQTISDAKMMFLIELWVTNGNVSTLPARN